MLFTPRCSPFSRGRSAEHRALRLVLSQVSQSPPGVLRRSDPCSAGCGVGRALADLLAAHPGQCPPVVIPLPLKTRRTSVHLPAWLGARSGLPLHHMPHPSVPKLDLVSTRGKPMSMRRRTPDQCRSRPLQRQGMHIPWRRTRPLLRGEITLQPCQPRKSSDCAPGVCSTFSLTSLSSSNHNKPDRAPSRGCLPLPRPGGRRPFRTTSVRSFSLGRGETVPQD